MSNYFHYDSKKTIATTNAIVFGEKKLHNEDISFPQL